ncbi:hypothetical protein ACC690_38750, partial [Rhizobium johnstonii]|uniref:hypothetical protein n=1 Tax=Rhizobium johnstonii TaxID=3019933 RepID=UPI003F9872E8
LAVDRQETVIDRRLHQALIAKTVVGGWVTDNQEVGEHSGVIRALNVVTGELEWAWDLGNPEITKIPPEGQTYKRATPNMWTT